jgi:hypothetical protein
MVETRFEEGAELVGLLDGSEFAVKDALWLYSPEESEWKLWLGTPVVDKEGPAGAYLRLRRVLDTRPISDLDLRHIVLVSPKHPLLQLLRGAIKTGPGIAGIRFSHNTINGTYIDDAFIYRLQ